MCFKICNFSNFKNPINPEIIPMISIIEVRNLYQNWLRSRRAIGFRKKIAIMLLVFHLKAFSLLAFLCGQISCLKLHIEMLPIINSFCC